MSMCLWVRAMDTYAAVFKMVEPKRLALAAAQVNWFADVRNTRGAFAAAEMHSFPEGFGGLGFGAWGLAFGWPLLPKCFLRFSDCMCALSAPCPVLQPLASLCRFHFPLPITLLFLALQAALDASNAVVAEKRAKLAAIRDKVAALQRQLADTQAELGSLTFQVHGVLGVWGLSWGTLRAGWWVIWPG